MLKQPQAVEIAPQAMLWSTPGHPGQLVDILTDAGTAVEGLELMLVMVLFVDAFALLTGFLAKMSRLAALGMHVVMVVDLESSACYQTRLFPLSLTS